MIPIFSPDRHSHPVNLIEQNLGLTDAAIVVPFESVADAKERFCFHNVRNVIAEQGGEIVYGWLVWQHGDIFVEAEHHAVWRKPSGQLVCVTPQTPPENTVTFVPDASAVYDFDAHLITNNIRIALVNDSRLEEVFRVAEQQTQLWNVARRLDPQTLTLPAKDVPKYSALEAKKSLLMVQVFMSRWLDVPRSAATPERIERVGRNEPCPCGSGKKYKKCHGM